MLLRTFPFKMATLTSNLSKTWSTIRNVRYFGDVTKDSPINDTSVDKENTKQWLQKNGINNDKIYQTLMDNNIVHSDMLKYCNEDELHQIPIQLGLDIKSSVFDILKLKKAIAEISHVINNNHNNHYNNNYIDISYNEQYEKQILELRKNYNELNGEFITLQKEIERYEMRFEHMDEIQENMTEINQNYEGLEDIVDTQSMELKHLEKKVHNLTGHYAPIAANFKQEIAALDSRITSIEQREEQREEQKKEEKNEQSKELDFESPEETTSWISQPIQRFEHSQPTETEIFRQKIEQLTEESQPNFISEPWNVKLGRDVTVEMNGNECRPAHNHRISKLYSTQEVKNGDCMRWRIQFDGEILNAEHILIGISYQSFDNTRLPTWRKLGEIFGDEIDNNSKVFDIELDLTETDNPDGILRYIDAENNVIKHKVSNISKKRSYLFYIFVELQPNQTVRLFASQTIKKEQ